MLSFFPSFVGSQLFLQIRLLNDFGSRKKRVEKNCPRVTKTVLVCDMLFLKHSFRCIVSQKMRLQALNRDSKPIWAPHGIEVGNWASGLNVGKLLVFNRVPIEQNPDLYYRNFQFMQLHFLVLLEE